MRMYLFPVYAAFILFISCNQGEKNTKDTGSQHDSTGKLTSRSNCYKYAGVNDTILLNLIHTGDSITGTLAYDFSEKDDNSGIINGMMKGNILVAEYTFTSEGVRSVRQVAFKLEDSTMVEGYGETYMLNDKSYFKNTDSLHFNGSIKLVEYVCQ